MSSPENLTSYPDLPPIPNCFAGAVRSANDANINQWTTTGQLHTLAENSMDSSDTVMDESFGAIENSLPNGHLEFDDSIIEEEDDYGIALGESHEEHKDIPSNKNSLETALYKLREEMHGLRRLDLSLFRQLWSLNESIQEFKGAIQGPYSETNSEYSYSSFSSYGRVSSMTSLDSFDMNDDSLLDIPSDSLDLATATNLLQQINELREKAELDFKF